MFQTADSRSANHKSSGRRAGPLTRRLVFALALFPMVPSAGMIAAEVVSGLAQIGKLPRILDDSLQVWMFLTTAGVTVASLAIWRRTVAWSSGRYAGTVLAAAVPLAQAVWWQPLWAAGCLTEDFLKLSQSTVLIGVWVWATVWVWWGWERAATLVKGRLSMSDSAKRIVLSFGTLPIVIGGYILTLMQMAERKYFAQPFAARKTLICANLIWAGVACVSWLLIWRSAVRWSAGVWLWTGVAALTFLVGAGVAPFLPDIPGWVHASQYMLPMMIWGGWMVTTILIWPFRSTAASSITIDSVTCGACGYNLRGLYATRCPECGDEPTLDELFTAAAGAADA